MSQVRLRAIIALGGALAATLLVTAAAQAQATSRLPALTSVPADGLTRALANREIDESGYALERARALFRPARVAARYGPVAPADPRSATLVLRDLALRVGDLSPTLRAQAHALLARPDDSVVFGGSPQFAGEGRVDCTAHACFHWIDTTEDAPLAIDSDADGIPNQVERTEATVETVWATEIDTYGYRPPKSDLSSPNHGPDEKIDIYLADVGADGLYGYCTTDDPNLSVGYPYGDASAYCVVDNDFSSAQFPGSATPDQALAVTVAHEFFHAIQFGYDIWEDGWFMEGTAVWMEDEVYDDVNDNYQYLDSSALVHPSIPIDLAVRDYSSPLAGFQYGAFLFFRYLSESFRTPEVIHRIWELAEDVPGSPDQYSLQAVDSMLRERGTTLRLVFAGFAAANVFPSAFYEEGAGYPRATPAKQALRSSSPARGEKRLDHLTSFAVSFRPGSTDSTRARLRVKVALPAMQHGSAATLLVVYRTGEIRRLVVRLGQSGNGQRTVPFGRGRVASVVLVLSNGSGRLSCWHFTNLACQGTPLDDGGLFHYQVQAINPL
jgi:hypothetical protein